MKTVQIALTSIAVSAIALLQAIISVGIQINIQDNDLQLTFPESYNMRGGGYRDRRRLNYDNNLHLDFALIGFPKTGTTFLLKQLEDHSQIRMSKGEFCQVHNVTSGAERVLSWLTDISNSSDTSTSGNTKYGIKCPTMVRDMSAIENLIKISDHTRLIVGVTHPVRWFEHFYNYRVLEMYNNNQITEHVFGRMSGRSIPKPRELLNGTKHWKDVSTASARFDAYLKQLAKVPLDENERKTMFDERLWPKKISPNPYKVFIYTVEQLHDKNETRQIQFQIDLQQHLGLNSPFGDFSKASKANGVLNFVRYKEQMDICDPQHARIRKKLVQQGRISSDWIINRFIESDDVVVSDKDYFTSTLRKWGNDPCLSSELVSQS